jgi:chromosome segregation ATPase
MSPTTASRLENRVKELEELLEQERTAHLRTEKELNEFRFSFDSLRDQLDEAENEISAQIELNRRKDQDMLKMKKDLETAVTAHEAAEASIKKRHTEMLNELNEQLERANKQRSKAEKEKQQLVIEIESYNSQLDASNKAKSHAESKLEGLEDQLRRLKTQCDDLTRSNQELTGLRGRLTQENEDLQRSLRDMETSYGSSSKLKIQLQQQLDEAKNKFEEESRIRVQIEIQLNGLQDEVSSLKNQLDEEAEAAAGYKSQASKWQTDFQQLKMKSDKDIVLISDELEEIRRKLTVRISELESEVEQQKSRASRLEKEKSKLTLEINEIVIQLEAAEGAANENAKRLKAAEHSGADLHRRVEELETELHASRADAQRFQADATRLKQLSDDLQSKLDAMTRENSKLNEALKDKDGQLKDLTHQSQEWTSIRIELLAERDGLTGQLGEQQKALHDLQSRLEAANNAGNQARSELEARLREKDDEMENNRRTSQRTIEELQRTTLELETRLKGEASRLKKKFESEIHEFEIQIDNLNRTNGELAKNSKTLSNRLRDCELALESERMAARDARDSQAAAEKKLVHLVTEIDEIRSLYDAAEKARKHAESELSESSTSINEINITVTTLTSDKRRLEGELTALQRDRDEAVTGRRAAEERADKLSIELSHMADQLRGEKESVTKLESMRKQLEVSVRELSIRIEEVEASKDGKKSIAKLQTRISDLEHELEMVSRREKEAGSEMSKLRRQVTEYRSQSETDHRTIIEYSETINILQVKIVNIKRQLEQSEEVLNITMNKYRKTQQLLEEAERRADRAENNMTVVRRQSVSVTRGIGGSSSSRSMTVRQVRS